MGELQHLSSPVQSSSLTHAAPWSPLPVMQWVEAVMSTPAEWARQSFA
jgi:hypothetical protein